MPGFWEEFLIVLSIFCQMLKSDIHHLLSLSSSLLSPSLLFNPFSVNILSAPSASLNFPYLASCWPHKDWFFTGISLCRFYQYLSATSGLNKKSMVSFFVLYVCFWVLICEMFVKFWPPDGKSCWIWRLDFFIRIGLNLNVCFANIKTQKRWSFWDLFLKKVVNFDVSVAFSLKW